MDLDFLANFTTSNSNEELSYSKKDILKFLKRIGVDTRFVSYFEDEDKIKLYIENFRFSKFSKKRIANFNNYYKDIEVVKSSLFQKICLRSSKILANSLKPKTNVLIPNLIDDYTKLLFIILEPYSRKYGINFIMYNDNLNLESIDAIVSPRNLNNQVRSIFTDIFNGDGIIWDKKFKDLKDFYKLNENQLNDKTLIFPLINVPEEWINDFLGIKKDYMVNYEDDDIASSFMGFLAEINPQFKENVLATSSFLEKNQK